MKQVTTLFFVLLSLVAYSQENDPRLDSILNKQMEDVNIQDVVVIYRTPAQEAKLRRDVSKAYPYALRAASIINQIEENTKNIKKKRYKRRYLKKKEKILRKEFEKNLRNLTKTQGRYMIRLINRETDNTVYNLIKKYKSGASAVLWQVVAKRFESDLKSTYDPTNIDSVDYEIESIVSNYAESYKNGIKNQIKIAKPVYRDYQ